jgi:terminal uridylyltransferase
MAAFIAQCEMLDKIAEEEIPQVEMPEAEFREKDAFRSRLEATCRDEIVEAFPELAATLNLRAYGSIISGFATKGSDVDLTILWSGAAREDAEFKAQLPRVVEKAILKAGHGARLLSRTRVPIVKVCELPTEELYSALVEERQKWEELPQEEKYPELVPQPDSPTDETHPASFPQDDYKGDDQQPLEIDPDVSRNGKKMETTKRVTMNDDPLGFLQQLKSKRRTEDDDLARYCTQFINARRFAMQTSTTTDDQTFTEWFLEGLPASVTQFMAEDRAIAIQTNAAYPSLPLFEQYYEVAHPIIARLSKSKRDTNKPWLREKTLGKLDFPKQGVGIQCDINFSNPLGMHNTELLRLYSLCDPRVRPMVLFIKAWAKRRKINSAYSGTLSSYGYVLMVLHFLLNVATPPVLPNLQLIFGAKERDIQCEGFNISFHADEAHIRQMAATRQWTSNTEPLGVLLRNFFHYYAAQGPHVIGAGFNWMRDVISIRSASGLITKEGKGWTGAKTVQMDGGREVRQRYLLAIEDPFEISHNVGRPVTHNGIVTVRDEFRRVWRILAAVGRGNVPEGGLFDVVVEAGVDGEKEGDVKVEAVALSGIGAQQPLQA